MHINYSYKISYTRGIKMFDNGLIEEKYRIFNNNILKIIAIIAMTIDHAAWLGYDYYPEDTLSIILHIIGRITAPIMIYFVAEGYHYTKNFKKYAIRMFILAVISHFAYCLFNTGGPNFNPFDQSLFNATSAIWPLFCGLMLLWIWD